MQGPVGLVYSLTYKKNDDDEDESEQHIPSNHLEGSSGRKMTLNVISRAVEAATRKLRAGWTIEAAADLHHMGLDIEKEMTFALSAEIAHEVTTEILNDLRALATKTEVEKVIDDNFLVLININAEANEIARKTRRGPGNFIVVSPLMFTRVKEVADRNSSSKDMFVESEDERSSSGLIFAGVLNNTIKVYVDIHADDDKVLVGYKGGSGEIDTGYVYCPYIMLLSSGLIVHETTFQPIVTLMTRHAKKAILSSFEKDASSQIEKNEDVDLNGTSDYYTEITFNFEEV